MRKRTRVPEDRARLQTRRAAPAERAARPSSACRSSSDAFPARPHMHAAIGQAAQIADQRRAEDGHQHEGRKEGPIVCTVMLHAPAGLRRRRPGQNDQRRLLVAVAGGIAEQRRFDGLANDTRRCAERFGAAQIVRIDDRYMHVQCRGEFGTHAVGFRRAEHDCAFVGRQRSGITVDGRDRFAEQFVEHAAAADGNVRRPARRRRRTPRHAPTWSITSCSDSG